MYKSALHIHAAILLPPFRPLATIYGVFSRLKINSFDWGIAVSAMYNIECDYRYLYVSHNYVFYRIESEKIIIVEMFDEREDFMYKLFGISTRTQESIDYWGDED